MKLLDLQALQASSTIHQTIAYLMFELLQTSCESIIASASTETTWFSDLQVWETEIEIGLSIKLCDVLPESLEIEVSQENVTIRGKRRPPLEMKEYFDLEFYAGQFQRTFSLSGVVQSEAVVADLKDSTLTLKMPKSSRPWGNVVFLKSYQKAANHFSNQFILRPALATHYQEQE